MQVRAKAIYRSRLWPQQRDAIDLIERYLADKKSGSALVHMPTGSGKSGVITTVSRCLPGVRSALALTPRRALRKQLAEDVRTGFFETIGVEPKAFPAQVVELRPSNLEDLLTLKGHVIYVATFQALLQIRERQARGYTQLRRRLDLVMADEGHYEPGPEWSKAVRSLDVPTVLLTATPYRNDIKAFNINAAYVSSCTFEQGVADKYLREVRFHELKAPTDPKAFVRQLLRFHGGPFRRNTGSVPHGEAKVIVRCQTYESVLAVADELEKRGKSVVAIHERFPAHSTEGEPQRASRVPSPRESTTTFWVHQYKLMEGIDDPSFTVLAFYEPLRNARALVQQVGRIVRNSSRRKQREVAHVLADPKTRAKAHWDSYRVFEQRPIRDTLATTLQSLHAEQPNLAYLLGEFRQPLDTEAIDPLEEILVPRTTRVFRIREALPVDSLRKEVQKEFQERDRREFRHWVLPGGARLHLWVSYDNSPLLASADVCSQAVKNLDYLSPYSQRRPPNFSEWSKEWDVQGVKGTVAKRIRTGQTPETAWRLVESVIRDPSATREVWVVMGRGFLRGAFAKRIDEGKTSPVDLQLIYQVQSTWSSVSSMGARFRILCSP